MLGLCFPECCLLPHRLQADGRPAKRPKGEDEDGVGEGTLPYTVAAAAMQVRGQGLGSRSMQSCLSHRHYDVLWCRLPTWLLSDDFL